MPPSLSALSRAALPTLAIVASGPSSATAQAPVSITEAIPATPPIAGGAALVAAPAATAPTGPLVRVISKDLTQSSGRQVTVRGRAKTEPVRIELRVGRHGRVVAAATANPGRRFRLQGNASPGDRLRLVAHRQTGGAEVSELAIGQVKRLRATVASWYGPGLFGNRTACGQTLTAGLRGVAHKSLPCGTRLTVRYRGRSTSATVVDRGPFHGGREFDLTYATARALGFSNVGRVWVSR